MEKYRNSLIAEGESVSPMTKTSKILRTFNQLVKNAKNKWKNIDHTFVCD